MRIRRKSVEIIAILFDGTIRSINKIENLLPSRTLIVYKDHDSGGGYLEISIESRPLLNIPLGHYLYKEGKNYGLLTEKELSDGFDILIKPRFNIWKGLTNDGD